jgi:hypothetical protein
MRPTLWGTRLLSRPWVGRKPGGRPEAHLLEGKEANRLSAKLRHHVLDVGVVLDGVHGEVLAVAGVLEAAVGHLGDERDVRVDPHASEVQPPADPHRPAVVTGEHARGEAVTSPFLNVRLQRLVRCSRPGFEVGEDLEGAIAARRPEDGSAGPGAGTAQVEVLDRRAVARIAGDRAVAEHLVRQDLAVEDVTAGDANPLL